jgi:hypothetical protein
VVFPLKEGKRFKSSASPAATAEEKNLIFLGLPAAPGTSSRPPRPLSLLLHTFIKK